MSKQVQFAVFSPQAGQSWHQLEERTHRCEKLGYHSIWLVDHMWTGGMPNLDPCSYLRIWEWREDKINLIGATQAITVRLRYEKTLPALVLGTDPVQIRSSTDALAYATAAIAARSRGARALAQDMMMSAQQAIEKLIERYVRPEQFKARRRKPYGYRSRIIYL